MRWRIDFQLMMISQEEGIHIPTKMGQQNVRTRVRQGWFGLDKQNWCLLFMSMNIYHIFCIYVSQVFFTAAGIIMQNGWISDLSNGQGYLRNFNSPSLYRCYKRKRIALWQCKSLRVKEKWSIEFHSSLHYSSFCLSLFLVVQGMKVCNWSSCSVLLFLVI